ncbi:MAG: radical SAM protein, partial [Oscillospiraceae bacterium]
MGKKVKHFNVAFFIPHLGCPHNCSFCDQKSISGKNEIVSLKDVEDGIISALLDKKKAVKKGYKVILEICFFGGSFTAISEKQMDELLTIASKYLKNENGKITADGIRISTRPDYINEKILLFLKKYGVTTIEIGCQSTNDNILALNGRGHTFKAIQCACELIKKHGFSLGCQMMAGLYGDTEESIIKTANDIINQKPDTVRIYPVTVLKNTVLETLYKDKKYELISFNKMVDICATLLKMFYEKKINVIKLGLHSSKNVEKNFVAGYYHPAFREICESKIYEKLISEDIIK